VYLCCYVVCLFVVSPVSSRFSGVFKGLHISLSQRLIFSPFTQRIWPLEGLLPLLRRAESVFGWASAHPRPSLVATWPIPGLRDGHSQGACQSIDCKAHNAALHRAAHWRGHSTHTQQPAPISDPPDASTKNVTGHARLPISTIPCPHMPTSLPASCASALRGTSSATPIPTKTSTASATRPPTMTMRTTRQYTRTPPKCSAEQPYRGFTGLKGGVI
jgi:hypothetical protein